MCIVGLQTLGLFCSSAQVSVLTVELMDATLTKKKWMPRFYQKKKGCHVGLRFTREHCDEAKSKEELDPRKKKKRIQGGV